MNEQQLAILNGAIENTKAMYLPKAVLDGSPTLADLVAFLMQRHAQHTYTLAFQPQRTSMLWWLEYALDGLFRRRGRGLHFACIQGKLLQQDQLTFALRTSKHAEAETRRRLLATIESLPLMTRVSLIDTCHTDGDGPVGVNYTLALRDVVLATRKAQGKSQFQTMQRDYNVDDLVNLLKSDAPSAPPPPPPPPPQRPPPHPTHWISETQRPSERIIVLLGGPMRLYYATLFLIGLCLGILAYFWLTLFA